MSNAAGTIRDFLEGFVSRADITSSFYGEMLVAERQPRLHIESQNGIREERDTVAALDGSDPSSASAGRHYGEIELNSGTDAGDSIKLESNQVGEYAASKQAQAATYYRRPTLPSLPDDFGIRWGYFNDANGMFNVEWGDGTADHVIRSQYNDRTLSEIAQSTPEAVFNGQDLATLDKTTAYVYTIDFTWYGIGPVVFAYEKERDFDPKGVIEPSQVMGAYDPRLDPAVEGQYMDTPNLPLRVEIVNGSSGPSQSVPVYVGGRQFSLVGEATQSRPSFSTRFDFPSVSTTEEPLVSIRPREMYPDYGPADQQRPNGINTRLKGIRVFTDTDVEIRSHVGGTVNESSTNWTAGGPTYSQEQSSIEVATKGGGLDITPDGKFVRPHTYTPSSGRGSEPPSKGEDEADQPLGVNQPLTLFGSAEGSTADVTVLVYWTESI